MKSFKSCALAVAVSVLSLSIASGSAFARGGFGGGFPGKSGIGGGADVLQQLDANTDGNVTLDEFTAARTNRSEQRFDALDQNDDGAVSAKEFEAAPVGRWRRGGIEVDQAALQQCMRDQGIEYVGRPTWEELAAAAGTSSDLPIDYTEFLAYQQIKAEERFAEIDANGDGALDDTELEAARSLMQERREARRTCIMEQQEVNDVLAF